MEAYFRNLRALRLNDLGKALQFLLQNRQLLLGAVAGLVVVVLFGKYFKDVVVIALFGLIAVYSTIYKRYLRVPPAVELITFSTVMVALAYGPLVGALFGAVITVVAEIFNSGLDAFIVGYVPGRAVVGFAAASFASANIVTLGLMMSILYNAIAQPLYALQSDAELRFKLLAFVAINISSNYIIFSLLGNIVKSVIV